MAVIDIPLALTGAVREPVNNWFTAQSATGEAKIAAVVAPSTEEQAILSQLADRSGVTLHIYHRLVEPMEQHKILQNATRKKAHFNKPTRKWQDLHLPGCGVGIRGTHPRPGRLLYRLYARFGITDSTDYATKR